MNTPKAPDKTLRIKAEYIGPIMKLDGALSPKAQNLLFATSGTGKSFLARSLRMFDDTAEDASENFKKPSNLVSEEGTVGALEIYEGSERIASLKLDTKSNKVDRQTGAYIFHVFTSDYVEAELRRKQYVLNGEITHEIIIGKENKELDEKQDALNALRMDIGVKRGALTTKFNSGKDQIKKQFVVNAALTEYRSLIIEDCLPLNERPSDLPNLQTISRQFKNFRDLPQDAQAPSLPEGPTFPLDLKAFSESLKTPISASSVAEKFKQKIAAEPDFYETGLRLHGKHQDLCPFCTQPIEETGRQAIDTYLAYFQDAEAKARARLAADHKIITQAKIELDRFTTSYDRAVVQFDKLKASFPTLAGSTLSDFAGDAAAISSLYDSFLQAIDTKKENLAAENIEIDATSIDSLLEGLRKKREKDIGEIQKLSLNLSNSDAERLKIQRDACRSFLFDFQESNEGAIGELQTLLKQGKALEERIAALQKISGEKVSAREKVADTFQELITFVFGGKYNFERERFVVQRNKADMTRGGDRTLSDGEKSILAFCYFLSQTHLRVKELGDYGKLFFVVDDPVSSVSFDYVYSVCQILKNLRIENGEMAFTGKNTPRPKMLLLTHHDYFYNVVGTNSVIPKEGLFQLVSDGAQHKLNSQKGFVSPHIFHLAHIVAVATEKERPNFATPNSIRSVLEGMWRFTRPDLGELGAFLTYVTNDLGLPIKSVLINDLSHGGKLSIESPLEEDIKAASKEAMQIVQKLAPGQLR